MPATSRIAAAVLGALLLAGCSGGGDGKDGTDGLDGSTVLLAPNTCWSGATLGDDPQQILRLSKSFEVDYLEAAHALEGRPAFDLTESCARGHHVEVYKTVSLAQVQPVVDRYSVFLQAYSPAYASLSANVSRACMNKVLVDGVNLAKIPGAVMAPAFGAGYRLGWAPPSPEQWERGQRVYACTLTSSPRSSVRYADVFRSTYPVAKRICIDSGELRYVDCARKHDRERIAVLDVTDAVLGKQLAASFKSGPDGRYVALKPSVWAALDKACSAFLRAVSTTKKLTGVAEIDADQWPNADRRYPINCEADVPPRQKPVESKKSVFDR